MKKNNVTDPQRIDHLDMVKAFAILMVFIGHRINNITLEQYIFSFHLPLFFWVSGFVYDPQKYKKYGLLLHRRLRTIIIPYFVFSVISYLFWLTIVRALSVRGQVLSIDPIYPFYGIFYGIGIEPWRNPLDIALWFLPCIFVTIIIFWIIDKNFFGKWKIFSVIMIGLTGYMTSLWLPFRLPWSADVSLTALVFYAFGNFTRKSSENLIKVRSFGMVTAIVLIGAIGFLLSYFNGKIDMNYNLYRNPLLFYTAAFGGIYFWYYMISFLPSINPIAYVGKNTIILIGLGGISAFIIRGIIYLITGTLQEANKVNLVESGIFSIFNIILLIPVIFVINRYIPWLIGRKKAINEN